MVAIGVDGDGCREIIGAAGGFAESSERWREFLSRPRPRGLRGVRMFAGDEAAGMAGPIAEAFPEAACQRRTVHFHRNVLARAPKTRRPGVAAMLKAIHAMESREAAEAKALEVASGLGKPRLGEAAMVVGDGCAETLAYARSPPPRALAEDQDRRRHRTPRPRDSQTHARGRHLPRRQVGPHARDREARARCGELLGLPALPGRDSAG